ncbi:hypothetical protein niasHT_007532 [Heterodera trifolii]|uniref:G-protein coupled receptors family 1 profile domain-containing protein n=1 Tax=Heterodera trifolii TaxID=157864 RepID=A0ABD2LS60_9BILA
MSFFNFSHSFHRCLSEHSLRLSDHPIETIFIGFLLPPLIAFGLIGNCLNLCVLLGPRVHPTTRRSNSLLAVLALLDVLFLLLMLPSSLAHFTFFARQFTFRRVYFATKIPLLALINQCSAAAIWIMLGICLERLVGIRRPFSSRVRSSRGGTQFFVMAVFCGTFLLTMYIYLRYHCIQKLFCDGTQLYSYCFIVDSDHLFSSNRSVPHSANLSLVESPSFVLLLFIRVSLVVHAVLVVFLPTVVVAMSNAALLWTLRHRDKRLNEETNRKAKTTDSLSHHSTSLKSTTSTQQQKARIEQRVTITVVSIITCFTITQTPSAVVQLFVRPAYPLQNPNLEWEAVSIFLVVLGKSLNFVLFCLSSAHFRSRLLLMLSKSAAKKREAFRKLSREQNRRKKNSCQLQQQNAEQQQRKNGK